MPFKIGIVMDPIDSLDPVKDSTLALMLAARKLGADLYYMVPGDLYIKDGHTYAAMGEITVFDDPENYYAEGPVHYCRPLTDLDAILMRKDPPVDMRFLHACAMLGQAERDGVRVVNAPAALMTLNEKLFATHFPRLCPPTLVTGCAELLRAFRDEHKKIIIKPLDSMGGDGVFLTGVEDVNFSTILEQQTKRGTCPVMAQAFLPAVAEGDRRILVIDGEPFPHALVRTPPDGSIRANIAAGGHARVAPISAREDEIARTVGPVLRERGIVFAGLDVIGGFLTEINITSPTGLRQIAAETGTDVADIIMRKVIGE